VERAERQIDSPEFTRSRYGNETIVWLLELWHNCARIQMPNLLATTTVTLSTNPIVVDRLERLVLTGAYGKNSAEAAERLLSLTLHTLDKEGEIPARKSGSPDKRSRKRPNGAEGGKP